MKGKVTSIGLLIKPSAKKRIVRAYQREAWSVEDFAAAPHSTLDNASSPALDFGLWTLDFTYAPYAQSVNKKKNPLKTSFRSEIQATDSTLNGCQANSAATNKLRQN